MIAPLLDAILPLSSLEEYSVGLCLFGWVHCVCVCVCMEGEGSLVVESFGVLVDEKFVMSFLSQLPVTGLASVSLRVFV